MDGVRVSVIIPSWNSASVLDRCLESLKRQELRGGFETIVIENGSTDDTPAVLERHADEIRVIAHPHNAGYAYANNEGAHHARGEILFLLNADTELLTPETLALLVEAVEQPGVAMAGPMLLNPDGTLQASCAAHPTVVRTAVVGSGLHRALPQAALLRMAPEFWSHDRSIYVDWLLGAALAVRADAYREVGGMWPTLFAEEQDLAYKLQRRGFRVRYVRGARVMHIGNYSLGQRVSNAQRAAGVANAELVFLRAHYPRWQGAAIRAIVGIAYGVRAMVHGVLRDDKAAVYRKMTRVYVAGGLPG